MFYSVIIPVYNRPDEIRELLQSLLEQTYTHFEVLIVEDGSEKPCRDIVESFSGRLDIRYFYKDNSGQGFSRNYGFERAKGEYLVVFDSDCLIPSHYFETVNDFLDKHPLDAWGGPDRAHPEFTPLQKAISYSMTSPFTTGGIRGGKRHMGTFHPRSFNMGISREVYETTGGYKITRMGEDIEFSLRIIKEGFKTGLIPDAYVYHKRRTDLKQFFRQLHFFGRARVNIGRFYPEEIRWMHFLPAIFTLAIPFWLSLPCWLPGLFPWMTLAGAVYLGAIGIDSTLKNRSPGIGLLSMVTSVTQLTGYGIGFLYELYRE